MSEFRKLQAKLQKIEEGYFKDLDLELQELRRANPRLPADQLVRLARDQYGQEAATYLSDQLEAEGDYADYMASDSQPHMVDENDRYDDETLDCVHCGDYHCTSKFGGECPEIQRDLFGKEAGDPQPLGEEDEDSHDIEPLLNDDEYDMVKRVMAQRGHEPHSLGFDRKGNINAKDDLSVGGPEYVISRDGEIVSLTYGPGYEDCPECEGKGSIWGDDGFKKSCPTCKGEGQLHTGKPAGEEINPSKQSWVDKFRSVVGEEEEEHPSEERTKEMTADEIHRIGQEDMGLTRNDANSALVRAVRQGEAGTKALYVIAPSGERLGPFNSLMEVSVDETDPATGEKFRVVPDDLHYVWNVTYEGARDIFQKFIDDEQQQKYKDAEYDWTMKWPGESIEESPSKKIGCLKCDEVSTEKEWQKNDGTCPKCKVSTQGVAESIEEETHMPDLDRYWVYIDRPDVDYVMYHIPRSWAEEGEPRFLKVDKATGDWQTQNWKGNNEPAVQQGKGAGPHMIEEDLHPEDSINDQIRSLLRQGKKIISRVGGAIGEVTEIDDRGLATIQHPPETRRGRSVANFNSFTNLYLEGQLDHYALRQNIDYPDDEIDEAVVEVPAELRGNTKMTGNATSADARRFLHDLGPDDDVSHDVVDPETGELLDWPTAGLNRDDDDEGWRGMYGGTKRERGKREWEQIQARSLENDDVPMLYLNPSNIFGETNDMAWEFLNELRDSDFYNVVWRNVADEIDDPEGYADMDYDVEFEVPTALKRKDGQRLTDDDHENIKEIIKAVKAASTMGNVGIGYAGTSNEGTTARFYPSFF